MRKTTNLDKEKRMVDRALRGTGYSSKTKSLWSYYRKGNKVLDEICYSSLSYLSIARKERVPKNMQKAFAMYYLNQVMNGVEYRPSYETTRKSTLERWNKAIKIVDKIR